MAAHTHDMTTYGSLTMACRKEMMLGLLATTLACLELCESCPDDTVMYLVHMSDSFGDGWNGNDLKVMKCDGSLVDLTHEPLTIEGDKFSEEAYICVPASGFTDYTIECGGSYWQDEISWSIDDDKGAAWHAGGSPFYYSTCPTPSPTVCSGHPFVIDLSDSFGDGWQGNEMRLLDCDGNLLKDGIGMVDGARDVRWVCLDVPQFEVQVGGGTWGDECSWNVTDPDGTVLFSGSSPFDDDNCGSCASRGGVNVTVVVESAHVPHGFEWWDPTADSFATVRFGKKTLMTKTLDDTNDPAWHTSLYFGCVDPGEGMFVKVIDEDATGDNDLLVEAEWLGWEAWPENVVKRLNDTQSHDDGHAYNYYVNVRYFVGAATWAPSHEPTSRPTRGPTPHPHAAPASKAPTHAPTHSADDGGGGAGGGGGGGGGGGDGGASSASAGSVVAGIFGTLGGLALVFGGCFLYAKVKGHRSVAELADSFGFGGGTYSPMGQAAAAAGGGSGKVGGRQSGGASTFSALHAEVQASSSPQNKYGYSGQAGSQVGSAAKPSGYVAPVFAVPVGTDDDEVDVGLHGNLAASV